MIELAKTLELANAPIGLKNSKCQMIHRTEISSPIIRRGFHLNSCRWHHPQPYTLYLSLYLYLFARHTFMHCFHLHSNWHALYVIAAMILHRSQYLMPYLPVFIWLATPSMTQEIMPSFFLFAGSSAVAESWAPDQLFRHAVIIQKLRRSLNSYHKTSTL